MHQALHNEVSIIPTALALTQWKGPQAAMKQLSLYQTDCRLLCHGPDRSFDPNRCGVDRSGAGS